MSWVIRTHDGEIEYWSECESMDGACEAMAQNAGYNDYNALCLDLGYRGASFVVSQIIVEPPKQEVDMRPALKQRMANAAREAFKFNRRNRAAN